MADFLRPCPRRRPRLSVGLDRIRASREQQVDQFDSPPAARPAQRCALQQIIPCVETRSFLEQDGCERQPLFRAHRRASRPIGRDVVQRRGSEMPGQVRAGPIDDHAKAGDVPFADPKAHASRMAASASPANARRRPADRDGPGPFERGRHVHCRRLLRARLPQHVTQATPHHPAGALPSHPRTIAVHDRLARERQRSSRLRFPRIFRVVGPSAHSWRASASCIAVLAA